MDQFGDVTSHINNLEKKIKKICVRTQVCFCKFLPKLMFPDANAKFENLPSSPIPTHWPVKNSALALRQRYRNSWPSTNCWISGSDANAPPYVKAQRPAGDVTRSRRGVSFRRIPFQPLRPSLALCQEAKCPRGRGASDERDWVLELCFSRIARCWDRCLDPAVWCRREVKAAFSRMTGLLFRNK